MELNVQRFTTKLATLAARSASSHGFQAALVGALREVLPFRAACCTAVDPHTLLSTGAYTEPEVEAIHSALFTYDFVQPDVIPYAQLAASGEPVATLNAATAGQPETSARYRCVLAPAGFQDELRAALLFQGTCWGYLTLFRHVGDPLFTEPERRFIRELIPVIALHLRGLRLTAFQAVTAPEGMSLCPGILILSGRLIPLSSNAEAERCLSMLRASENLSAPALPRPVQAAAYRALGGASSGTERFPSAAARIGYAGHPCITIRASLLAAPTADTQIAVSFAPAAPADILPLQTEACGLSDREKQVVELLIKGLSTKEVAATLHISPYTVNDHLKSIFAKTGTVSRSELVWRLFSRFSMPH